MAIIVRTITCKCQEKQYNKIRPCVRAIRDAVNTASGDAGAMLVCVATCVSFTRAMRFLEAARVLKTIFRCASVSMAGLLLGCSAGEAGKGEALVGAAATGDGWSSCTWGQGKRHFKGCLWLKPIDFTKFCEFQWTLQQGVAAAPWVLPIRFVCKFFVQISRLGTWLAFETNTEQN